MTPPWINGVKMDRIYQNKNIIYILLSSITLDKFIKLTMLLQQTTTSIVRRRIVYTEVALCLSESRSKSEDKTRLRDISDGPHMLDHTDICIV